jgi:hypothetical protein
VSKIVKAVRRHVLPYRNHKQMLQWLCDNIQENYYSDGSKYNSSSVSQFVEWRSKDRESWVFRIVGNPPKCLVEIISEEKEILFLLAWQ